jgi:hypothetical protein
MVGIEVRGSVVENDRKFGVSLKDTRQTNREKQLFGRGSAQLANTVVRSGAAKRTELEFL